MSSHQNKFHVLSQLNNEFGSVKVSNTKPAKAKKEKTEEPVSTTAVTKTAVVSAKPQQSTASKKAAPTKATPTDPNLPSSLKEAAVLNAKRKADEAKKQDAASKVATETAPTTEPTVTADATVTETATTEEATKTAPQVVVAVDIPTKTLKDHEKDRETNLFKIAAKEVRQVSAGFGKIQHQTDDTLTIVAKKEVAPKKAPAKTTAKSTVAAKGKPVVIGQVSLKKEVVEKTLSLADIAKVPTRHVNQRYNGNRYNQDSDKAIHFDVNDTKFPGL